MSVKSSNWVWHALPNDLDEQIKHAHFVVLLALADIADDDGVCTHGDPDKRKQPALAKKSRMSESTFRRKVRDLEEMGLVGIDIRGLQNVYRLNFGWPEPLELSTGHSDRWENARLAAASRRGIPRSDRSHRSTVTGHRNVIHKDLNQSHEQPHLERANDFEKDDWDSSPRGWAANRRARKAEKSMNYEQLELLVADIFHDFDPATRSTVIWGCALSIIAKALNAGTKVGDPTAYVAASIRREPDIHRTRAFQHEANL